MPFMATAPRTMQLDDNDVQEFQALYRKRYGKDILKEDAYEQATKLVRLLTLFSKEPLSEEEFERIQKQIQEHKLKDLAELTRFVVWKMEEEGRSN